jgi:uncharacterized membrane protein YraQ (UPF0718 family)
MSNKILEKFKGKTIFVVLVLFLYSVLLFINFNLAKQALIQFFYLAEKIIPVLLLVFVLMFVSNIFFQPKRIIKFLGESAGFKGYFISVISGILSAGPIYAWYPLLSELKEKGMRDSFIAVFLYNRAVKIPLIPIMIYYFGLPLTLTLSFYMIVFSVINGILVGRFLKTKKHN